MRGPNLQVLIVVDDQAGKLSDCVLSTVKQVIIKSGDQYQRADAPASKVKEVLALDREPVSEASNHGL